MSSVNISDSARDDISLEVDLWDNATDPANIEALADEIEQIFNVANLPQEKILPTFFRESRVKSRTGNRNIQHIVLTFTIQNYERG